MAQHVQILQTISSVKTALKRHNDGNHQNDRLKRRARARLNDASALSKKSIAHAGYTRATIFTNPLLIDDDGSACSSEDEAAELLYENPFEEIHIDDLLRPLTSAADLYSHPTLSLPYKSNALTQMVVEVLEMLRRERASLWQAKRLLQRFRGDRDWVPSGTFETESDEMLLIGNGSTTDQSMVPSLLDQPSLHLEHTSRALEESSVTDVVGDNLSKSAPSAERHGMANDEGMEVVETQDMANTEADAERGHKGEGKDTLRQEAVMNGQPADIIPADDATTKQEESSEQVLNPAIVDIAEREAASETASNSNGTSTHGMTTRARARSPAERSDRTPSPSPSDSASAFTVNPWFVAPPSCLSDRDLGLSGNEAEETRKLLLLYVQKQEQIVRSFDSLYTGLQKADRLRQYVYRSCKAEAHLVPDGKGNMVTGMSDGEDWYDLADWSLQAWELKDGDLEKGKDEVEDVEEEGRRRPGRGRRVNRM